MSSKKIHNRIIYPSTFVSFFNQISRVGSPILDFIKHNLVTKYVIKSIKATDPVTKLFLENPILVIRL